MADLLSSSWSWFIFIVAAVSLLALMIFLSFNEKRGHTGKTTGHVWDNDVEEYDNPLPAWWLKWFYSTIVFCGLYLMFYPGLGNFTGFLHWTQERQYQNEIKAADAKFGALYAHYLQTPVQALAADPKAVMIGKRLFKTYCTSCHGTDAQGVLGYPNLRDNDWLYGNTPEAIENSIKNGRFGAMPAWEKELDYQSVFDVAEYVRGLSGRHPVEPLVAAKGKQVFEQNCVACHGMDGKGNQMVGAPNLADDVWLYGDTQQEILATITKGREHSMPAHGMILGDAKVHLLAGYIYKLSMQATTAMAGNVSAVSASNK